MDLNRKCTSAD